METFGPQAKNVLGNRSLGQEQKITGEKTEYIKGVPDPKEDNKSLKDVRDNFAPNADKPTTSSAQKGLTDLPSILSKIDPSGISSVLPSMFQQFGLVKASVGGTSQGARKKIIEDSLTGALIILTNKYGYEKVITAFEKALINEGIKHININYRDIVKNALANLIQQVEEHGPNSLPVLSYKTVTEIGPEPSPIVNIIPNFYIQQYFIQEYDPYPGYIRWNSSDITIFVYTRRRLGEYYFESPEEEIKALSELELAKNLDIHIRDNTLTARLLNNFLTNEDNNVGTSAAEKGMGKNSSKNLMNSLTQLLGYVGSGVNSQQSTQLPVSVLNKNSIASSLQDFSKNMGMVKSNLKPKMKQAIKGTTSSETFEGGSAMVSSLQNSGVSTSGINSTISVSNIIKSA
jgi:hypothetical protein